MPWRRLAPEPEREPDERPAERERRNEICEAERPPDDRGHRHSDEGDRVPQDLARRLSRAAHDRQHRDPSGLVVLSDQERQRPEVGWGPEEDDQEEPQRRQREIPGNGGPADERR